MKAITVITDASFELLTKPTTMKWHCCACHQNFQGPTDRTPPDGCPHCGSHEVFDCNVESVNMADFVGQS